MDPSTRWYTSSYTKQLCLVTIQTHPTTQPTMPVFVVAATRDLAVPRGEFHPANYKNET